MEENTKVTINDAGAYLLGKINVIKAQHSNVDEMELLEYMRDNTLTDPEAARAALYGPDKEPEKITKDNLGAKIAERLGASVEPDPEGRGYKINHYARANEDYSNGVNPNDNQTPRAWELMQKEEDIKRAESRKVKWYEQEDTKQRRLGGDIKRALEAILASREVEEQAKGFTVPEFNPGKIKGVTE